MAKKKGQGKDPLRVKTLTIADVEDLGKMLIEVSNHFPVRFRTERDFYPLVRSFLWGRLPKVESEARAEGGRFDFRVGSINPAYLELVVTARDLVDLGEQDRTHAPRHDRSELYGSANKKEIEKLGKLSAGKARGRFLLLIDLQHEPQDFDALAATYKTPKTPKVENIVNVIYTNRRLETKKFKVCPPKVRTKGY